MASLHVSAQAVSANVVALISSARRARQSTSSIPSTRCVANRHQLRIDARRCPPSCDGPDRAQVQSTRRIGFLWFAGKRRELPAPVGAAYCQRMDYGCETGATRGFARCATCSAWIRKIANAPRHTPYAAKTPKASAASVAQTNINTSIAFCISSPSPTEASLQSVTVGCRFVLVRCYC